MLRRAYGFLCVGLVSLLPFSTLARADTIDENILGSCMFEKASSVDLDLMKRLLVAAINEDLPSVKGLAVMFTGSAVNLATTHCGIPFEKLSDPAVAAGMRKYGEKFGEKIVLDAFAKLQ